MEMINKTITAEDGAKIYCYFFYPEKKIEVKAIVQIIHGLGEHAGRYIELATKLTKEGYIVCAEDHRGFGRTAKNIESIGHIPDDNGHELIISDILMLLEHMKSEYSDLPYFIFGHSMGSFLARSFILKYSYHLSGVIIASTRGTSPIVNNIEYFISKAQKNIFGGKKHAKLFDKLSVGGYGAKYFKSDNSINSWLTSDKEEIELLNKDDYFIKHPASIETYIQLFRMIKQIEAKKYFNEINKNIPILFVAGDKDPVGNFGKSVRKVYNRYLDAGVKDIELKLYKDGRHELLKDKHRYEVMNDITNWLDDRLPTPSQVENL